MNGSVYRFIKSLAMTRALFLLILLTACGKHEERPLPKYSEDDLQGSLPVMSAASEYRETGDLDALNKRGYLRILVSQSDVGYLARRGYPPDIEREIAADFARSVGLTPVLVYVPDFKSLIPALRAGQGDIIAANLTITDERSKLVAFTTPIGEIKEQLVVRADDNKIGQIRDLAGRTIAVQELTSFWETAKALQERFPEIKICPLPDELGVDGILDLLAAGKIDVTMEDSNVLEVALCNRRDVRVAMNIGSSREVAWSVRLNNHDLLNAVNHYLLSEPFSQKQELMYRVDWPGIKKKKVIRMITRNNAACYYLWRGGLMGFEYEMAKEFARQNGLRLEVIVAPTHADMVPMLMVGEGDFVAAFLTPTPERKSQGVSFSRPYSFSVQMLVTRSDENQITYLGSLENRIIAVRQSSSYWSALENLKRQGVKVNLQPVPESMETLEVIEKVGAGDYDLTLADAPLLDIATAWHRDVKGAFPVGGLVTHSWLVRESDKLLLDAINDFWAEAYRSGLYATIYNKYFRETAPEAVASAEPPRELQSGNISPYDKEVKSIAEKYGFDWRLIVALMYQESHFDPAAISKSGAMGLMQVMPHVARAYGYTDLTKPEINIRAGVRHLDWIRNSLGSEIVEPDRTLFMLAAYNAGLGHVQDARILATRLGLDSKIWKGNVEKALLLLSTSRYANQARFGFIYGEVPVRYVREIMGRYNAYKELYKK